MNLHTKTRKEWFDNIETLEKTAIDTFISNVPFLDILNNLSDDDYQKLKELYKLTNHELYKKMR